MLLIAGILFLCVYANGFDALYCSSVDSHEKKTSTSGHSVIAILPYINFYAHVYQNEIRGGERRFIRLLFNSCIHTTSTFASLFAIFCIKVPCTFLGAA